MAWSKNGTTTLSSAGDTVTVSSLTASDFNQILVHQIESSANILSEFTFNNNTNSVYAKRYNYNGGGEGTTVNASNISAQINNYGEHLFVHYVSSISGEEKLGIMFSCARSTAGAGNAPGREEFVYKFVPSPDADITRVDMNNASTGDYDTGTNVTVLNGDTTESLVLGNIQSGSRMEVTDTRKIYYWNGSTFTEEA